MQFYFLSVLFNLLVGISLTFSGFKVTNLFPGKEKVVKLVIGIAAVFTGVMKFIFVIQPDWVVLGDFLPAVAGIVGGVCYIIDCCSETKDPETTTIKMNSFFEKLFVKGKKYIGIVCIAVAIVHFIFPTMRII
ncbi:MAG: hypothetical protein J5747_02475 [Spirochaetaceae bacterium]|nr:hypothetical protein [Spirochaetaceae bacterium]